MFENTLIASRRRREVTRKLEMLPVALGIHALALGFVLVTQLWAVGEVPEPYTVVSLYNAPPPPPPAGRPTARGTTPARAAHPALHPADVPPVSPPTESAKPATPDDVSEANDVEGGDEEGDRNGLLGGVKPLDVAPLTPPIEPERIYKLNLVSAPPTAIRLVPPSYPEAARRMRIEGIVLIDAVIDRFGNVASARLLRDLPLGCGVAALAAVQGWKYRPATLDGRSVSVQLLVKVTFRLDNAG